MGYYSSLLNYPAVVSFFPLTKIGYFWGSLGVGDFDTFSHEKIELMIDLGCNRYSLMDLR